MQSILLFFSGVFSSLDFVLVFSCDSFFFFILLQVLSKNSSQNRMNKGRETIANFNKATSEEDVFENKIKWEESYKDNTIEKS